MATTRQGANRRASMETDALRDEGARVLGQSMERLSALEHRLAEGAVQVRPGSQLYFDDQAEEYDPPSMQCAGLINVALDHLVTVRALVTGSLADPGILPVMAGYTLVRSVVEASATGLWLRSGGTRNKRVFASLRYVAKSRRDAESTAKSLNLQNPKGLERMTKRLEEIRDRGGYRGHNLDSFPKVSDILRNVEKLVPAGEFAPLGGWQAMSGMAHANRSVMLMLLEHEQVGLGDEIGSDFRLTSSLYIFGHLVKLSVNCLTALIDLVEKQATTEAFPVWWTVGWRVPELKGILEWDRRVGASRRSTKLLR